MLTAHYTNYLFWDLVFKCSTLMVKRNETASILYKKKYN